MSEHNRKRSLYWVRWALRAIALVAIIQSIGALAAIWGSYSFSNFHNVWVVGVFALSSILLWRTQPQFSAIFALFASSYGERLLRAADQPSLPLYILIGPLLWLLLFEHPVRLPSWARPWGIAGLAASIAAALPLAVQESPSSTVSFPYYALAALALILLTQRCLAARLHKSPRTLIFAISVAPLVAGILVEYTFGLDPIAHVAKLIVGLFFTIAPIGTLLYELASRRTAQPRSTERSTQLEHHRP